MADMKVVGAPLHAPGICWICGTTPKGPYLDYDREHDIDWMYTCLICFVNEVLPAIALDDEFRKASIEALLRDDRSPLDRLFICRYENCGHQSKSNGGRSSHERFIHGQVWEEETVQA